jgi:methane monooxygenase component C
LKNRDASRMAAVRSHQVTITFEGAQPLELECRENEDIITAGLRQGLLLLSDCRQGICGACRGFLEDGHYDELLSYSPHVLAEQDAEDGWILACRLCPRSNLLIDFDYAADRITRLDASRRSGKIVALEPLSPSVMRVVVTTLSMQAPLHWQAGQYVRLHLAQANITRSFSMANLPNDRHELEFLIGLRPDGQFPQALLAMRGEGDVVAMEGPLGNFTLDAQPRERVFVAEGTGLAPILAMLRQLALTEPDCSVTLIFGVPTQSDLFAQAELAQLAATYPGLTIQVTIAEPDPSWSGYSGSVVDGLADWLKTHDSQSTHYYFCGSAAIVRAARRLVENVGVLPEAIHQELFVSTCINTGVNR